LFERVSPKISAPLRDLEFFCSGIENAKRLELRIKKLGGRVISPGANTAKKTKGTLFFLSDVGEIMCRCLVSHIRSELTAFSSINL
jgi:hypothetical protein